MNAALLMIAGAALVALAGGYLAKTLREHDRQRIQPPLPFEPPTTPAPKPEKEKEYQHA